MCVFVCVSPFFSGFRHFREPPNGPIKAILEGFVDPYGSTKPLNMDPIGPLLLCYRISKPPKIVEEKINK